MKKYGVAVIGAGVIGTRLSDLFVSSDKTELILICDTNQQAAKDLATKHNIDYTSDINTVFTRNDIDIVYIGVPPKYHHELTIQALDHGKHVICEKPISLNSSESESMLLKLSDTGKIGAVNLILRYSLGLNEFKKLLGEGYIGELRRVDISLSYENWPRSWQNVAWLSTKEQGGALREVGSHFYFAAQELFGKIKRVNAIVQYESDSGAETGALGTLEFESGLLCSLNLIIGTPCEDTNSITAFGSKGKLSFQGWYQLFGSQSKEELRPIFDKYERSELKLIDDYCMKIENPNHQANFVTFKEAANVQEILDAIYNSNGNWIEINKF
ncbi:MAG: Gfo/Idh/MocA family oxidoreductase [Candidatus Heimdallarchaeota archaeon]|nr:Gfo/Idh/MocA family oxidoreductase [Candidatus Heimdallarchaeota archaeon]